MTMRNLCIWKRPT